MSVFVKRKIGATLLLSLMLAGLTRATELKSVLIINSDASVDKFLQIEESFTETYNGRISKLDLGPDTQADAKVRRALLTQQPDLVFCVGPKAYLATNQATQRVPIIFSSAINWQRLSIGRNSFGIANELPVDFQFTTFRHLFPSLHKLGLLYSEKFNEEIARVATRAGKDVGIDVLLQAVHKPSDLDEGLRSVLPRVDALWLISDPTVLSSESSLKRLFDAALKAKVPVIAYDDAFIESGALLAITADLATMGSQAAFMAEQIGSGQTVKRRVMDPAGSEITLNAKVLPAYALSLNKDAVSSVNRLIR